MGRLIGWDMVAHVLRDGETHWFGDVVAHLLRGGATHWCGNGGSSVERWGDSLVGIWWLICCEEGRLIGGDLVAHLLRGGETQWWGYGGSSVEMCGCSLLVQMCWLNGANLMAVEMCGG